MSRLNANTPARTTKQSLIALCLLFGFAAGYLLSASARSSDSTNALTESVADRFDKTSVPDQPEDLLKPSESLSPMQVVKIQMEALSKYHTDRTAIHQVFAYASPANRAVTGPLPRFEQMILQKPYNNLVISKHWMVGKTVQRENSATVLVSTVDTQGRMSVFRFVLSKQTETNAGCWMTDGVFLMVSGWHPGEDLPGVRRKLLDSI